MVKEARQFVRLALILGLVMMTGNAFSGEISYNERFALGGDRQAALKELIPGTEEAYYYNALQFELEGDLLKAKNMLDAGVKKFGHTTRLQELEIRYALKIYESNPGYSLSYLQDHLGLHFNHQQKQLKPEVHLPIKLDQNLISFEAMAQYALEEYRNTSRFEDSAFDYLVTAPLTDDQRRDLLSRLRRPDYPGIVLLIIADLDYKNSSGFGSHAVHQMLTGEQLEECLKLRPDLMNQSHFIHTYLTKLRPDDDVNWQSDDDQYMAYLKRLQVFADRLPLVQNSLKANILYRQLEFNVKKGSYDKALFDRYIRMPRLVSYINPEWLNREEYQYTRVNMHASYAQFMALEPIGDDELVVRRHLMYFLKDAADIKEYEDFVEYNYLKSLFAEVKLVNGIGDAENWYALMDSPTRVKDLRDRIDIELLPTNVEYLNADEDVFLDVAVKNVKDLAVKVFEINTTGFYRQNLTEITTSIELDGLVPNSSKSYKYDMAPMLRHEEKLAFPEIKNPGVYVIELIGNGVSSRAVVRKGRLTFTERIGSAGHVFSLFDEDGQVIQDAVMWMAGTEYKTHDGEMHVPFSGQPQEQKIVFTGKGYSVLRDFQHLGENYELKAGMFLGREQLVAGKECTVAIRPELLLNGEPIDVSLLEDPILTIRSLDIDGHSAEKQVNDFKLRNDSESVYSFRVPKRLRNMSIVLSGKVQNLNAGQKLDLMASKNFGTNQINETYFIEDVFFRHTADGYIAELLGRNAEARDGRVVQVELKHRDFTRVIYVSLKTDEKGRVYLGALKDIEWVALKGTEGAGHKWFLPKDNASQVAALHILSGETLRIPVMDEDGRPLHRMVSLLEKRGEVFVKDRIDNVRLLDGYLVVSGLSAGDYDLVLKPSERRTTIRVTDGKQEGLQLLGKNRVLEKKAAYPLQIQNINVTDNVVEVNVANAVPGTRVHMYMTRYVTDSLFAELGAPAFRGPTAAKLGRPKSQYLSGRRIGDEYRYVMERKNGMVFPGNMLTRPSLILNPWNLRSTDTGMDLAREGEEYERLAQEESRSLYGQVMPVSPAFSGADQLSSFDFLNEVSPMVVNLIPDKDGLVKVPLTDLPYGQQLHVYAVNASSSVYRQRSLQETAEGTQDLRLKRFLDPTVHFTEQKRTNNVRKGETFIAEDILSAQVEVIDSIEAAYRLLTALNNDATLAEFNFIVNWPEHSDVKKRELYKKYACHEMHVFLAMKDPEFFQKVVRPYIADKKDRTFMDDWLLGNPLEVYLEPWNYSRLNMVERAFLAQQMKEQQTSTARHLKDLFDLIPPDVEKFNFFFDAALGSSGLGGSRGIDSVVAAAKMAEEAILTDYKGEMNSLDRSESKVEGTVRKMHASELDASVGETLQAGFMDDSLLVKEKQSKNGSRDSDKEMMPSVDRSDAPGMQQIAFADSNERSRRVKKDAAIREQVRQLYRKLEKTKEWVENNYYQKPITEQVATLVEINEFWKEYASWDGKGGFLSGKLTEAGGSLSEIMLALAVLDLPFKAGEHDYQYKDGGLVFKAASDTIVFHKQVQEAKGEVDSAVLLIHQSFFAKDDRYRYENNEQFDKFVTGEFEKGRVYGCQLVLTNPTSTRRKVDVLQQIPAGAIPVLKGMQTKSRHAILEPYSTQSQEYYFYFPVEGDYPQYPAHVAQNEEVVAAADPFVFKVVSQVDRIDKGSWEHISQYGMEDDVIKYLDTHNIDRLDLDLIAWRVRGNKAFFERVLAMLVDRKVYNPTLWSYALYHNVKDRIREYLPHTTIADQCGLYIKAPLLDLDPVIRHAYEHKEYWPLVNSRVFKLGSERKILNEQFFAHYEGFMKVLTYKKDLTDDDKMSVVIYMLLQDRIEEAMHYYKAIDTSKLTMGIQYDYMSAYMSFYMEKPDEAKMIALKYKDYPVDRWKDLFQNILAQCDEIVGKSADVTDDENRTQTQTKLADTAPRLEIELVADEIKLTHANLAECTINYYPMDIELLFSRKPFVKDVGDHFTVVKPYQSVVIPLGSNEVVQSKIPEDLNTKNLMIEVTGSGISRLETYFPNALKVDIMETYGQLRVADKKSGQALAKVYVKVYARTGDGQVKFYKDGYTDLRGRFDYTSLNTDEMDSADKFSILIMSDSNGAMVREASPPKR